VGLGSDALHLMSVVAPLNIVDNFSNASVCQPGKQLLSWRSFWMAWMRCSATHLVHPWVILLGVGNVGV
jgi:hypothetical protein